MRRLTAFLFAIICIFAARADGSENWNVYLAYHNNTFNVPVGSEVYSLCDGNLFAYDYETTEVRLLSKLDGLNGKNISRMGYSLTQKCLVLLYDDGNIDLLYDDGDIANIPAFKNSYTGEFTYYNFSVAGDWAVVSMPEGILLIDVENAAIKGYYPLDEAVFAATVVDDCIFAAYNTQVIACNIADNPSDRSQWNVVLTAVVRAMQPMGDRLYFSTELAYGSCAVGLYCGTLADGSLNIAQLCDGFYPRTYADASRALFANTAGAVLVERSAPTTVSTTFEQENGWAALTRSADGTYWASESGNGLQAYKAASGRLTKSGAAIGGYGPKRDLCYYMKYYDTRLRIAGGRLDPYDRQHYDPTLEIFENDTWTFYPENVETDAVGLIYRDVNCVAEDPSDPNHVFSTCGGAGLFEWQGQTLKKHYSVHNSPLTSAASNGSPNYVRLDGLNFDASGNLWLVNNQVDTTIRILRANGTWDAVYAPALDGAPTLEKTLFDAQGNFWVCSRRTVSNHTSGLFCLSVDGTQRYRSSCLNEDGTSVSLQALYAIAEDQNGQIWVGCESGVYVVEDPADWFSTDFTILQIKVPRNDGTNLADYLLSGISVSAIAVDAANRKWLGTYGSGVYLVSADGTEILEHFQAEDTPLLSDNIYSLAINPETGEVMIGTDLGLCSYLGTATAAADALEKSNVRVYPNPVAPDYSGLVRITGLTADADVLIVSVGGQAIAGGTSMGGTFTWDCRDQSGRRVAPGVYYVMISTADAKKGVVAKVVVI